MVLPQVYNSSDNSKDRAGKRGAASTMVDHFAADTILLVGEGERGVCGCLQVGERGRHQAESAQADKELYVSKTKRGVVAGGTSVLAGAQQEKESDAGHVRNTLGAGGARGAEGRGKSVHKYLDRYGLDAIRWGVGTTVGPELALESKIYAAERVFSYILGPQAGERLTDGA